MLQQHFSGITGVGKVDFPMFDGTRIQAWLFKVQDFFSLDYTPPDVKVEMAACISMVMLPPGINPCFRLLLVEAC